MKRGAFWLPCSFYLKRASWVFKEDEKQREGIRAELTHYTCPTCQVPLNRALPDPGNLLSPASCTPWSRAQCPWGLMKATLSELGEEDTLSGATSEAPWLYQTQDSLFPS